MADRKWSAQGDAPAPTLLDKVMLLLSGGGNGTISLSTLLALFLKKETVYNSPGDFTPGVTSALTMPAASSGDNETNVEVSFEGLNQISDGWSIVGTAITFTAPIPIGVTKIAIKVLTP